MKKHLHLNPGAELPEISPALNARILAAASFKANAIRHRRKVMHWSISAAAALLLISGMVFFNLASDEISAAQVHKKYSVSPAPEILALSDMTVLEQENFTVAIISEYGFSSDHTII